MAGPPSPLLRGRTRSGSGEGRRRDRQRRREGRGKRGEEGEEGEEGEAASPRPSAARPRSPPRRPPRAVSVRTDRPGRRRGGGSRGTAESQQRPAPPGKTLSRRFLP